MNVQEKKWLAIGNIRKEAVLTGKIKSFTEEKQRFYHNRFIYVQELKLQTVSKQIIVKRMTPVTKNAKIDPFTVGDVIRIYGNWDGNQFHFHDFELVSSGKNV
ncbi:hypothetical protein [Neobacillus ginsengisoli]|uniref:DUF3127 domain-containing protein n=1 Tax=Neobacillus ginsengisoli TaxID=904295 RepID=A0ABT9XSC5_9BACI|nr:hypothetical protein [Neobacillus ginsengisoli]MDQ0198467.1 hypothetical protein [Neobacillus ginsengisoli]